jgi:hypothetical protein
MGCSGSFIKTHRLKQSEFYAKVVPLSVEVDNPEVPETHNAECTTARNENENSGPRSGVKKLPRRSNPIVDFSMLVSDTVTSYTNLQSNHSASPLSSPVESSNALKEGVDLKPKLYHSGGFKAIVTRKSNINDPRCYNGHILRIYTNRMRSWSCYYCGLKSVKEASFYCKLCEFDICSSCYIWEKSFPKVTPQYIKCPENHDLRVTSRTTIEWFYKFIDKKLPITCRSCSEDLQDKDTINHCRICRFDLCNPCKMCIQVGVENQQMCPKSHVLRWQSGASLEEKRFKCEMCRKDYEMLGSFACLQCKYSICIRCSFGKIQI